MDVQARHRLTCIWIGHDLSFLAYFAHEVVVMDRGRIVESTTPPSVCGRAQNRKRSS